MTPNPAGVVKGWTVERMDVLQERVAAGVSEAAIALELDMPERIINLKRLALGLKYPAKGEKSIVRGAREIAEGTQTETPTIPMVRPETQAKHFKLSRNGDTNDHPVLRGVRAWNRNRSKTAPTIPAPPTPPTATPGPIMKAWEDAKAKEEPPKMPMPGQPMSEAHKQKIRDSLAATRARKMARSSEVKPGDLVVKAANGEVATHVVGVELSLDGKKTTITKQGAEPAQLNVGVAAGQAALDIIGATADNARQRAAEDQMVRSLMLALPREGTVFPREKRIAFINLCRAAFDYVYGPGEPIEVK